MLTKGLELKALDDEGHGLARFATLSAIDHDGDTYAAGAFGEQWAKILPAHDWTSVPLGKARIYEDGDQALAELHLNLGTEAGRDWHSALKFDLQHASAHPLQEWSYGFTINDSQVETRDGDRIRVIKRITVHEVSPVVIGAGINTATLSMKHGARFADQIDEVARAVRHVVDRAKEVAAMRAEEGRSLSGERVKELAGIKASLNELGAIEFDLDGAIEAGAINPRQADHLAGMFGLIQSRRHLRRETPQD